MADPRDPLIVSGTGSPYRTSDLYYAAYLYVAGVPLRGTDREGKRVVFLFEDQGRGIMRGLKNEFFNDQAKVPALSYAQALKKLKGLLFK